MTTEAQDLVGQDATRADLLDAARAFAAREIAPLVRDYDREETLPLEIVAKMGELGWIGSTIEPEFGGQGLDWLSFAMLIEEISRVCHVMALVLSLPSGLVGAGILRYGTAEQKREFVQPLLTGVQFAGAGVTEPGGGTDLAGMRTRCRRDGDEYVIQGAKAWISMLDQADWFLTFATLDPSLGRRGVCAFIVDADAPGVIRTPYKNKLGFRPISTGDLVLDDVRVPADRLVGGEGRGYDVVMAAVETGRLSVAARAIGLAQASLDSASAYAREREVFGKEIGRFQLVQSMITDMVVGIEGARAMTYDLATAKDNGIERPRRAASLAKMHATDAAMMASTNAVQIHGAAGVSEDFPVGRYFRDAKVFQIIEGNNQLHRSMVAEYAMGYRGVDK
jgi:alkylation response protein AidB-like acyl-CoA dehydrogenase